MFGIAAYHVVKTLQQDLEACADTIQALFHSIKLTEKHHCHGQNHNNCLDSYFYKKLKTRDSRGGSMALPSSP